MLDALNAELLLMVCLVYTSYYNTSDIHALTIGEVYVPFLYYSHSTVRGYVLSKGLSYRLVFTPCQ